MKTILHLPAISTLACFLLLLYPLSGKAQLNDWTKAQALTDSSPDNLNAAIYQPGYAQDLLFWERYTDANTSEICMRDIYDTIFTDIHVILSQPSTLLTNPVILNTTGFNDFSNYYLFYQTNEGNDADIKYIKYYSDGSYSQPFVLTEAPGNDINLRVGSSANTLVWENEGKIMVSSYLLNNLSFTSPVQIDNENSYSPVFFEWGTKIAWLKHAGANTYLKFATIIYSPDTVEIDFYDSISISGYAERLRNTVNIFYPGGSLSILTFQKRATESEKWGLYFVDFQQSPTAITEYHSNNYNYMSPVLWDVLIPVDWMPFSNVAFVSDSLGNNEVFASSDFFYGPPSTAINVSNFEGDDRNPSVYFTFHGNYLRTHIIWESFRNGHWVIYRAYNDILWGGIEQTNLADNVIISPNPFSDRVSIRFKSNSSAAQVKILNMRGQCVNTLNPISLDKEYSTVTWDGKDAYDQQVPAGSYIVSIPSANGTTSKIILKSK